MVTADRRLISAAAFLRSLATGMLGVMLGIYLGQLGLSPSRIGYVIGAGLAGGAAAALVITIVGSRLPRRGALLLITALTALGGIAASLATGELALLLISFFGMLNGMGRDRGAALIIEQALLPETTSDAGRTKAFAWYNVMMDSGHALGGILVGLPALLALGGGALAGHRLMLLIYAGLMAATGILYLFLSTAVGGRQRQARLPVSAETRRVVTKISGLFLLDSLGGGFLTTALLSYFFFERFGVSIEGVGALFFVARLLNALSHLGAAWLAKRIGLVNTMVFTHIPSSVLLATVAIAPSFAVAAILFLLREGLVEMDVPTRQSFVMAVVKPEERTYASGVTHLVRMGGWAVAPAFAGVLMEGMALATPLVAGAGLKMLYDLLLYSSFRKIRPPEEGAASVDK